MTEPLLRLRGIHKAFGSVRALDGATLDLFPGEVHGLLGANGAGKSTLLNVLGGMLQLDAGEIELRGKPITFGSPRDACESGIGLVHQHFTLVPTFTASENIRLGQRGLADFDATLAGLMERTGLRVALDTPVEELGVGAQQRVEILKALLRTPRVLVLDEPTAVLAPVEIDDLFSFLRSQSAEGVSVVIVAHKLDEVLAVTDRVTVLRAGATVYTGSRDGLERGALVEAMVGRESRVELERRMSGRKSVTAAQADSPSPRESVARLEGVVSEKGGVRLLDGVDLQVSPGETVGIAGIEGNGQRELALILSKRTTPTRGTVAVPGEVGFVPADRQREGVIGSFTISENMALSVHDRVGFRDGPWLRWPEVRELSRQVVERFDVEAPSIDTPASSLSGGNQQRVLVGREVERAKGLFVAENPTRGLDVDATAFVQDELRRLASEGMGVVLITTDLDEVLELSDRIFAIVRGRLRAVPPTAADREGVGALMLAAEPVDA